MENETWWYLVADCLEPGCDERHVLAKIASATEYQDALPGLTVDVVAEGLDIRCRKSGTFHNYRLRDTRPTKIALGPPDDFAGAPGVRIYLAR